MTGCGPASTLPPAELHAAAAKILLKPAGGGAGNKCAFSSCHDSGAKKASLDLSAADADLKTLLGDKAACEAPNLKLVDTRGGDAGLAASWLWLKLTAPADSASSELTADPSWGTPGSCGQSGGYGQRMPIGAPMGLAADVLAPIRDWICAGAPGK